MADSQDATSRPAAVPPPSDPPYRVPRPMLFQDWRDCSFIHWPYEPDAVIEHVPRGFELETYGGRAWVSLITFRIARMRPGGLPAIPGLSSAVESHLRTYVIGPNGRRGIWMLSLDIAPLAAAVLGRAFALPYWWSKIHVSRQGAVVRNTVRRRLGGDARLQLGLKLGLAISHETLGDLDHSSLPDGCCIRASARSPRRSSPNIRAGRSDRPS